MLIWFACLVAGLASATYGLALISSWALREVPPYEHEHEDY